uniref:NAD(P)-dependent dehydrogenase, short-chain alcohol dehydrogenase family n=1 Tax=Candidatus Kentrum sp. MB TaxID=2138164 RepID=A0A451BEV1_9GAMM|nr:MAG: NAD(P)-dependent dehydrogenase, short-chain alcohol dehydrogenase family [Candidatus Kentron sp. MB]VFK30966.1 MAG: NAD(P)-dependent dehydrogenase, short-chain alcohol dehydrogenase family [Candidatus Kentron sp. MB]VFK76806.1 MAG: NAD(P)-dependent dehydrogenase, short-chain alcohol dehydrogenase family [Candidatus Kentron sp. MB]
MYPERSVISEKTFLVTGAGTGIGYAIAEELTTSGASVILHCNSHIDKVRELSSNAKSRCLVIQKDLSEPEAGSTLVTEIIRQGFSIDGVVNNAGTMTTLMSDDEPLIWEEKWIKTLRVNLIAASSIARTAIEHFKSRGSGIIVNISSRSAHRGDPPAYMHYAASKAGLDNLTKSIARHFASDGILAYSICPGLVDTEMASEFIRNHSSSELVSDIPLKRMGRPDEIASMVVFLLSGKVPFATGASMDMNGASYVR